MCVCAVVNVHREAYRRQCHTQMTKNVHTHTHTVYVCHVKIEANEIEYLTQSRNPTGSILSQSYYSVYYICNGTTALKKKLLPKMNHVKLMSKVTPHPKKHKK